MGIKNIFNLLKKECETIRMNTNIVCILTDINTGEQKITKYKNLFLNEGKVALTNRMGNLQVKSSEALITWGAVGVGASPISQTDGSLDSESARKQVGDARDASAGNAGIIKIRTFFTKTEANATLKEFGLFGEDATAGADSGTIFNRVLFSPNIIKTSSQTLSVEVTISLTSS